MRPRRHGEPSQCRAAAPPVVVATVRRETVPISDDYEGTLGSIDSVEVRARVEGTLDSAPFKEGDLVHKGDLIFRIQQNEYIAALHGARRAQLGASPRQSLRATGRTRRARTSTVARNRPLAADKAIPQKDLDNAIQNAEIAKGDVAGRAQRRIAVGGQATVDNAKINLGYTTIRAPRHGLDRISATTTSATSSAARRLRCSTRSTRSIRSRSRSRWTNRRILLCPRGRGNPDVQSLRDQELRIILANDRDLSVFRSHLHR